MYVTVHEGEAVIAIVTPVGIVQGQFIIALDDETELVGNSIMEALMSDPRPPDPTPAPSSP